MCLIKRILLSMGPEPVDDIIEADGVVTALADQLGRRGGVPRPRCGRERARAGSELVARRAPE
jgi:hypothetical protein